MKNSFSERVLYAVVGGNTDDGEGTLEGVYASRSEARAAVASCVNIMLRTFVQDLGDEAVLTDYEHDISGDFGWASDGATTYNFTVCEFMIPGV